MHDLTNSQFNGIKALSRNPLISQASIDLLGNGLLRVSIISVDDADFNLIDMLLEDVFPGKEYRGSVGEDTNGDYYSIDVDGETLISLMMKKTPVEKKFSLEEIMEGEVSCGAIKPYLCQIP